LGVPLYDVLDVLPGDESTRLLAVALDVSGRNAVELAQSVRFAMHASEREFDTWRKAKLAAGAGEQERKQSLEEMFAGLSQLGSKAGERRTRGRARGRPR
jgi:hypothetical protein